MPMETEPRRKRPVLDHGYVQYIEDWGHGLAGVPEAGVVEAARQSTQGSFRGWEDTECPACGGTGYDKTVPDWNVPPHAICKADRCKAGKIPGDQKLLKFLYNSKPPHATPFEFAGMTIEVQAPIFVFREWHRHRTQSYNEMSARYAPLPDLNYVPAWENLKERGEAGSKNKQASGVAPWNEARALFWWRHLPDIQRLLQNFYEEGLGAGVPKELARIELPVGRYSRMRASANLRNWLAFMTLRADPGAQWEIRQFATAVGEIVAERFPRVWSLYGEARRAAKE